MKYTIVSTHQETATNTYTCEMEAESLSEAIEKVKASDDVEWSHYKDYEGETDCIFVDEDDVATSNRLSGTDDVVPLGKDQRIVIFG